MDIQYTKKAMRENHTRIISLGYCEAQHLLWYQARIGYSGGSHGWDCDYYHVDGGGRDPVLISTGYRPLKAKNTDAPYALVRDYDADAAAIISDRTIPHEQKKREVNSLLHGFIAEALEA